MADLIVVLDAGKVLEAGTHAELMRNDALYAELYALQARAYR
jgi:ABC-type multidrug transport system fused ATPase/permease subunit